MNVVALRKEHVIVGKDFWSDAATGNWAEDCITGRTRAELVVGCLASKQEALCMFTASMRDMVEKGQWTGVEVGFCQRVIELAVNGLDTDANR